MSKQPIRILQIVENLHNQAVESWLFKVFSIAHERYPDYEWTFFCTVGKPGQLDDDVRRMGAQVIHSPYEIKDKRAFIGSLRKLMQQQQFDILHCHHDIMSAPPLLAAAGLPLRKRIAHVHNTAIGLPTSNPLKTALMREPFRQICLRAADHIVGVSEDALDAMLDGHKRKAGRDLVIHCGIDVTQFQPAVNRNTEVRHSLDLPAETKLLLFVGRMIAYKNPCFIVEVLHCLSKINPNLIAVFAGTGPQEDQVRELARQKSLQDRVKVLGWRDDVPQLMQACDILIWPGLEEPKEGLGLGIVEAQAAGLPVLMSRNVPVEAIVVPELVEVLPLQLGPQVWADAVSTILGHARPNQQDALAKVEASSFAISQSADSIMALYRN